MVNLTPPGAEPHDVELSAGDVETVRNAEVVVFVEGFQPALERALGVAEGRDPHVWLSPQRMRTIALRLGDALDREAVAARLAEEAIALDEEYRTGLRECARRSFVTTHAAFGWLAREFALEQVPISGLSPEAEPTPQELKRVVQRVRASGATTIFTEPLVSPRIAETVARETGAQIATLDPLEGEPAEGDYFTVMRANLAALRKALGCR